MDDIRIAVVGLGRRGVDTWLRLLQRIDGYRVVALCDPIVALHARALATIQQPHEVRVYHHLDDVLADPNVDAVALTVRCAEQGALAAQALRAGKHVHAEVPAAHTIADCWEIVRAVEQTGRVYLLAEQTRYWGFVDAWRALVAEGRLGHITLCEGQYFHFIANNKFQDPKTGQFYDVAELAGHPEATPTWSQRMPPIHYLPHELGPMLKVLDDRVSDVVAMGTRSPSYAFPAVAQPDMQVALMKTEKDTVPRMAASFAQPHPPANYHWYQLTGTQGRVEWKRAAHDRPKLWLAGSGLDDLTDADWDTAPLDAPDAARESGHGGVDLLPHLAFRDAVWGVKPLEFDVYRAMDTAAPAILAAASIEPARGP
jgi:predicted dehydrogenase